MTEHEMEIMKNAPASLNGTGATQVDARNAGMRERIQDAYLMAAKYPRNEAKAAAQIIAACKRPTFASEVEYLKPIGKGVVGASIRFAEYAIRTWGNVVVDSFIVPDAETELQRTIKVTVTDVETNTIFSRDVVIDKTVERKVSKGRDVVGQRRNSFNETTYVVKAYDDELEVKQNAMVAKAIRNESLRLIPQDIVEDAITAARNILKGNMQIDPEGEKKKLIEAFKKVSVSQKQLIKLLGHNLDVITPDELIRLRGIHKAITREGAKWSDYESTAPADPEKGKSELDKTVEKKKTEQSDNFEIRDKDIVGGIVVERKIRGIPDDIDLYKMQGFPQDASGHSALLAWLQDRITPDQLKNIGILQKQLHWGDEEFSKIISKHNKSYLWELSKSDAEQAIKIMTEQAKK